ncbi:hypothetical protein Tco_1123228 [Tanacetum coccineum]|uniref:Uncharacterized protein n=1 Tax=Tanacetum coccineum TaxID=301880 RepID=A0ABQ5J5P5_9ASTR
MEVTTLSTVRHSKAVYKALVDAYEAEKIMLDNMAIRSPRKGLKSGQMMFKKPRWEQTGGGSKRRSVRKDPSKKRLPQTKDPSIIEDMLLLLVQGKLTNLNVEERIAFNVSLRMFTRSVVIQRRVEDLQLGVESYQKKLNLTKLYEKHGQEEQIDGIDELQSSALVEDHTGVTYGFYKGPYDLSYDVLILKSLARDPRYVMVTELFGLRCRGMWPYMVVTVPDNLGFDFSERALRELATTSKDMAAGAQITNRDMGTSVVKKAREVDFWVGSGGPPYAVHRFTVPSFGDTATGLNWLGRASRAVTLIEI